MLRLSVSEDMLNINYQNIMFIWASYPNGSNNYLGLKNQRGNNGMCWRAPEELEIFKKITSNYGKTECNNVVIIGKTTASLVSIRHLSRNRDVYVLDYMIEDNEKKSIIYRVNSNKDIITEEITEDNFDDLIPEDTCYELSIGLEILAYHHMVFIIGGLSVYNYFLERFPLISGFISRINNEKVSWEGDIPIECCNSSDFLYEPNIKDHIVRGCYKDHEKFKTLLYVPSNDLMKKVYHDIKANSNMIGYDIKTSDLKVSSISTNRTNGRLSKNFGYCEIRIPTFSNLYVSDIFSETLNKLVQEKQLSLEIYQKIDQVNNMVSQKYFVLHNNSEYLFLVML